MITGLALALLGGTGWYYLARIEANEKDPRAGNYLRDLLSLPYMTVSSDQANAALTGVTRFIPEQACSGYNLYTDERYAYLIDMGGRLVHRWTFPDGDSEWEHVEFLGDGTILANCNGEKIVKLDRDSNLIWSRPYRVHHDIAVDPDGTILIPIDDPFRLYRHYLVKFDSILRLDEDGEIVGGWTAFSSLKQLQSLHQPLELDTEPDISGFSAALKRFYFRRILNVTSHVYELDKWVRALVGLDKYDYYHLNAVEVLPQTELGERDRRFAAGNILTCLRHAGLILILDRDGEEILWSWGPGDLDWPHMPTMLDDGSILVYDNGAHRTYSRVLELDPVSREIVWQYQADPPEAFYSKTRGSNQRLANGNTLICESERGRVFEVTPEGEVVWEFYNPDIRDGKRRLIYRMERIPPEEVETWLGEE